MPPSKPKPSEIAADAKKTYIPYIRENFWQKWPASSYLCFSESMHASPPLTKLPIRFAFYERDPVDVALDWSEGEPRPVPVIMPANDKRPGGDWESGVMSPEECLCRRSNLYGTMTTPGEGNPASANYPIPSQAGIYSQSVVVFRNGPEKYEVWPVNEFKAIPIISVCPVKRPKLDSSGKKYSFKQEKELMRDKIRTALRIATFYGYSNLCIGSFGLGSGFRNPPEEVAAMWRDAFLKDPEFVGHFHDVVFAFEPESSSSSSSSGSKSSSSKSSSSKSSSSKGSGSGNNYVEIFKDVFNPSKIHGAFKS